MRLIALPYPILISARNDIDLPGAVEAEGNRHGTIQEVAVVADDQNRPLLIRDHLLQQVERLKIEVVGWLIQHQQVRFAGELAGKEKSRTFTA